ncbi:MAG TPA: BatD protein, partial [Porphyromonadaceae bacterium]|nr:BatD protein [Porphyromonadaceae bacterium]
MSYFKKLYTIAFLVCIGLSAYAGAHAQVTFKASAPAAVEAGQQFRLSYVLNKEGKDLRLPDIKGFDILFGPTVSSSFSQRIVNGKSSSESSFTYTYILMADKEGTYTIDPASITVDGSTYRSNSLHIKVLPADESSSGNDSRPSED